MGILADHWNELCNPSPELDMLFKAVRLEQGALGVPTRKVNGDTAAEPPRAQDAGQHAPRTHVAAGE